MPEKLPAGAFYGQTICAREVTGFRLTECRFVPGTRIPAHEHAAAHICVVMEGQYVESYGRRVRCCTPRTVILHPDGEIHAGHISPQGARDLAVEVLPQRLTKIVQDLRVLHEPAEFSGGVPARCGLRLYKEFCMKDTASGLAIEAAIIELLVESARVQMRQQPGSPPPWLRRIHDRLRDLCSGQTSLSALAESASVHVGHLARSFRRHYGCSVGEYIRRLRIDAACAELSRSDKPISAIAAEAGFYDQAHFTNLFKARVGVTPGQFRALRRVR
jgi:AraC family transcriptional regulator